jgi:Flp pilus assembly pilin Flp
VSNGFAGIRVNSNVTASKALWSSGAPEGTPYQAKGGESDMTLSQWINSIRARFQTDEGQTMAEYGVVLAVICVLTVAIFGTLSGGIQGAIQSVVDVLPGA